MIDEEFEQVKDFHRAFNHLISETPVLLSEREAQNRAGFMREEIDEFMESENVCDQADAMIDLIYFALGTLVQMGVKPKEIFDIVHNANMTKIWDDGLVHHRESDGKVIKPPSWEDPYPKIKAAIERMGKNHGQ